MFAAALRYSSDRDHDHDHDHDPDPDRDRDHDHDPDHDPDPDCDCDPDRDHDPDRDPDRDPDPDPDRDRDHDHDHFPSSHGGSISHHLSRQLVGEWRSLDDDPHGQVDRLLVRVRLDLVGFASSQEIRQPSGVRYPGRIDQHQFAE